MRTLDDYSDYVEKKILEEIRRKAKRLAGKHLVMISSTHQGGGVAELLNSGIPLLNSLGVKVGWRILHGTEDFFAVTKTLHNGLQGEPVHLTETMKRLYFETNRAYSAFTHLDHDLVVVHDPQPLPLINFYPRRKNQPWILRLHIDLSVPNTSVWKYLGRFVKQYDRVVLSSPDFLKRDLGVQQSVFTPAIDPLSEKNKPLRPKQITALLHKFGISQKKPILAQISRFDKWKDPTGVIKVFELTRGKKDCQLILMGNFAPDDPEGRKIYEAAKKTASQSKYSRDIRLISVDNDLNDLVVNALQRAATVVIQKSVREGFGLVVAEALHKGTPVVASRVGGIPLQVIDGKTGFLHEPNDLQGFSESILRLLSDEQLRSRLGKNGREHVKNKFLITTWILNWLELFERYLLKSKN
jgi:trehalose synthase